MTQFARTDEDVGKEPQGGVGDGMAVKALYGPQKRASTQRRGDGCPVRHLGHGQRAFEVSGNIAVCAGGRDGIAEDLAANRAHPLGGFVATARLDRAED